MQPEKILESDSLDILFEHRNKLYGAYELRKKYNKRLLLALGMGLLVISIPTVYIGFKKFEKLDDKPKFKTEIFISHTVNLEMPKPTPKKQEHATSVVKRVKPALITAPGLAGGDIIAPPLSGGAGNTISEVKEPGIIVSDPNIALPVAEQMPAYPGGLKALRKFLEENLESPRTLYDGEKVNVQVKFIVGYDGNLKSFELVKDGGAVFNREVFRVLKLMPKWIPGKNAGKNVSVYFSLPVSFVPQE